MPTQSRAPDYACKCDLWQTDPASLEELGLGKGWCGVCHRCGKRGHTYTHPGRPELTGYCDDHWADELAQYPLKTNLQSVFMMAVLVITLLVIGLPFVLRGCGLM